MKSKPPKPSVCVERVLAREYYVSPEKPFLRMDLTEAIGRLVRIIVEMETPSHPSPSKKRRGK